MSECLGNRLLSLHETVDNFNRDIRLLETHVFHHNHYHLDFVKYL